MNRFIPVALAAGLAAAAPLAAQPVYDWTGGGMGTRIELLGRGVPQLLPELRQSLRGRAFVVRNFDANDDGRINPREAEAANRAFLSIAGANRGRFDWEARARPAPGPVVGGWDRSAMRGYGFRQTARGAQMTMAEEVLFATDSATLRPGAVERLRALAGYLRANPRVRVAIDGHTDARGTDAHNRALSERRAEAVHAALVDLGAGGARYTVVGHGERQPVASNATAAGMRQNRRVEITLLGQRADGFRG